MVGCAQCQMKARLEKRVGKEGFWEDFLKKMELELNLEK